MGRRGKDIMSKYTLKEPIIVDAVTFDELVAYGRSMMGALVDADQMPWSFTYCGHPVTHENDECYLIPFVKEGVGDRFTPADMLVTGVTGNLFVVEIKAFNETYEKL